MNAHVGVDLGGTSLRAAVIDTDTGAIHVVRRTATAAGHGELELLTRMAAPVDAVIADSGLPWREIGGVGVGILGLVDLDRRVVLLLPNVLGNWPPIAFRDELQQCAGLPVNLLNDVRCITLAEWTFGAGRGVDTLACYAIGTGIGGGVIVNGRLHLGISGSAGELDHHIVEPNGLMCKCGGRGCLEMYAAGPAIRAQGVTAVVRGWPTRIAALAGGDLNRVTTELVLQAARDGDPYARAIFEQAGVYLGFAIANTLLTISPRKVVIAGGVAVAAELLLDPIRRTLHERVFLMPADRVEITLAELGTDAGIVGAALWSKLAP